MKKPALIIGSGPSVDKIKSEWLPLFETYGCNSAYAKFKEWGRATDNVIITDSTRLKEINKAYESYRGNLFIGDERRIVPSYDYTRKLLGRDFTPLRQLTKKTFPVNCFTRLLSNPKQLRTTVFDKLNVSFNLQQQGFNFGRSVSSSAVQLAVARGHKEVYMIGIDASYTNEKDYFGSMKGSVSMVNNTFIKNPRMMMEPFFVMSQILMEEKGAVLTDLSEGGLRFVNKNTIENVVISLSERAT